MVANTEGHSRKLGLCALFCVTAIPLSAFPQAYPNKPIRVITQFASGASGDYLNRLVVTKLSELVGQAVVVENNEVVLQLEPGATLEQLLPVRLSGAAREGVFNVNGSVPSLR